jgi:hypothetical protein
MSSKNISPGLKNLPSQKSGVTLWKSKYNQGLPEEDKKIEDEYIDNLKKQIYFMEMELKLMKEREKEVEKTGGFTQLFNDDRDPSQHILQLKQKYANMRKMMEAKLEDIDNKRREVMALNVSLKAKLDSLKKVERQVYDKLLTLDEKSNQKIFSLENDLLNKNRERLELEANNRLAEVELKNEIVQNIELDYLIQSAFANDEMKQAEFLSQMEIMENSIKEKIKAYEEVNNKIKDLETKTTEEPYFKVEYEKNAGYKKKIEQIEKELLEINSQVESLQMVNDFFGNKKEEVIAHRKKLINTNDELKKEIEAKTQLNEIRIQKKVKENNSEEIQKLQTHLNGVIKNITDLEKKNEIETDKIRMFSLEIIKLKIELKHKEEKSEQVISSVDTKYKELSSLKDTYENVKKEHIEIKDKVIPKIFLNHNFFFLFIKILRDYLLVNIIRLKSLYHFCKKYLFK